MLSIAVINGPNLNTLGTRQPEIYGTTTLAEIEKNLVDTYKEKASFSFFQSNDEGALIDYIQKLKVDAIVINPGALSHTSIAIRDAIAASNLPIVEVHISNIFKREPFRHHSYVSGVALGLICGLGTEGYSLAVRALLQKYKR